MPAWARPIVRGADDHDYYLSKDTHIAQARLEASVYSAMFHGIFNMIRSAGSWTSPSRPRNRWRAGQTHYTLPDFTCEWPCNDSSDATRDNLKFVYSIASDHADDEHFHYAFPSALLLNGGPAATALFFYAI